MNDTSSPAPTTSTAAPDVALLDRARTALAVGDSDGYRKLVDEAADLTDPHRRYVVRRTLVELALKDAGRTGADTAAVLLAAAHTALTALEAEPAEPVILNLAGVALFQIGGQRGAEAVLEAAARLDPEVTNLQANLAALEGLRSRRQQLTPPAAIARAVADLDRRAIAVARRATPPAEQPTISLCMIVKDEEATLGRALASAKDVVDEIIVVDTGSQDRTVEIAEQYGAKILTHAWNDDFAAARNVGVDAATGDWILFLDADEALAAEDAPQIRELVRRSWREGFLLTIVNEVRSDRISTAMTHYVLRLFRNRPAHRFEGRIHEGVLHALPGDAPERLESADVRIDHDGYLEETRAAKGKTRRNLELLERQLQEGTPSAYLCFNLGSEYLSAGDPAEAVDHLGTAWDLLLGEPSPAVATFGSALALRYTTALRLTGRLDEAIAVAGRGLELYDGFTDLLLEQALAHRAGGDLVAAERVLRIALDLGDAPPKYAAFVGAGTFLAATELAEIVFITGRIDEARALLERTVAEHPQHQLAGRALDVVRAAAGEDATSALPADALSLVAAALDARLAAVDVDGFVALLPLTERIEGLGSRERRELLACLYLDRGFVDSAADEWAAVCEEHGPDAAALTGLSRVAAARGNAEDAEVFAEGARELAAQGAA